LPDIAKSVHGEMQAIEEGGGFPPSLSEIEVAIAKPPPAESPANAILLPDVILMVS